MDGHDPDDPLEVYLREVTTIQPLTEDEEMKLFQKLGQAKGDHESQILAQQLFENRLALVVAIAGEHSSADVPMLDLIQEGNVALMEAVRIFAKNPTDDFTAYTSARIEDAMLKALAKSK